MAVRLGLGGGAGGDHDAVLVQDRLGGQALEALAEQVRVEEHLAGGDATQAQAHEEEASGGAVVPDELVPPNFTQSVAALRPPGAYRAAAALPMAHRRA